MSLVATGGYKYGVMMLSMEEVGVSRGVPVERCGGGGKYEINGRQQDDH